MATKDNAPQADLQEIYDDAQKLVDSFDLPDEPKKTLKAPKKSEKPALPAGEQIKPEELNPSLFSAKEDVVDSIMRLQKLGIILDDKAFTQSQLMRKPRKECNRILGNMANIGATQLQGAPAPKKFTAVKDEKGEVTAVKEVVPISVSEKAVTHALYQTQRIFFKVAELTSINFRDQIGGTDLEGLSEDLEKQEKELKEALADIYKEHGPEIAKYLTSFTRLSLVYLGTISQRYAINHQKKQSGTSDSPQRSFRRTSPTSVSTSTSPPVTSTKSGDGSSVS